MSNEKPKKIRPLRVMKATKTEAKEAAEVLRSGDQTPIGELGSSFEETLAVSLSRLAYSIPKKVNRRSRFWFSMDIPGPATISTDERAQMAPRKLDHIDSEIVERLSTYQLNSPRVFQGNIEQVREFFLNEIAPKTLAVSGGTTQATEVLKRMLETDIDASTAQRFLNMINRASTLKMAQFVATYFGLDQKYVDAIIGITDRSDRTDRTDMRFVLNHVDAVVKELRSDVKKLSTRIEDAQK